MSKHTPGKLVVDGNDTWNVLVNVEGGGTVCSVDNKGQWFPTEKEWSTRGRSQNQMIRDAQRLALCWNTHDQLAAALEGMCSVWATVCYSKGWDPDHVIQYTNARAAIKAAKGEA